MHPRKPIPITRSILWRPRRDTDADVDVLLGGADDQDILFVDQQTLIGLQSALGSAGGGAFGLLVGQRFECPNTDVNYMVVDAAMPAPSLPVARGHSVPDDTLAAALDNPRLPRGREVLGWYRAGAGVGPHLAPADRDAHLKHFREPWQVMLLLAPRSDPPAGGFFRVDRASGLSGWVPFHELLHPRSQPRAGAKRSSVAWPNYVADEPVEALPDQDYELIRISAGTPATELRARQTAAGMPQQPVTRDAEVPAQEAPPFVDEAEPEPRDAALASPPDRSTASGPIVRAWRRGAAEAAMGRGAGLAPQARSGQADFGLVAPVQANPDEPVLLPMGHHRTMLRRLPHRIGRLLLGMIGSLSLVAALVLATKSFSSADWELPLRGIEEEGYDADGDVRPSASPSDSLLSLFDRRADTLKATISSYRAAEKRFKERRVACPALARAFRMVDERFVALSRVSVPLDSSRSAEQKRLAKELNEIEASFNAADCSRP